MALLQHCRQVLNLMPVEFLDRGVDEGVLSKHVCKDTHVYLEGQHSLNDYQSELRKAALKQSPDFCVRRMHQRMMESDPNYKALYCEAKLAATRKSKAEEAPTSPTLNTQRRGNEYGPKR